MSNSNQYQKFKSSKCDKRQGTHNVDGIAKVEKSKT